MSVLLAVVFATTATALAPARTPLRRKTAAWCFTLPLCLAPTVPAVVLPVVVGLASWALLGLREIGLLIENPFRRSLQLTQCTDALGREIDETLALHR